MPTKILIVFYSRNLTMEALARAIAKGAESEGAEVRMRRVRDIVSEEVMAKTPGWAENAAKMNEEHDPATHEDAEWADGIIFGTPSRFGAVCAELKAYVDGLAPLWAQNKLTGKVGSVFSASSTLHGGNEATILSMFAPLSHLGFIIVPLGYTDPIMYKAGSPYGATAATGRGNERRLPNETELAAAHYQGQRVTRVAAKLKS